MRKSRLLGISFLIAAVLMPLAVSGGAASAVVAAYGGRAAAAHIRPTATPSRPKLLTHPVRPLRYRPDLSSAQAHKLRAAATRSALARATVSACSGQISADTLYSCQTPSSTGTDTFTLTVPDAADVLLFQVLAPNSVSNTLPITVTAPGGSAVTCQQPILLADCTTTQAGTYTLAIASQGFTYTLEYTALLSESNCPALNPSFASSPTQGSTTAGQTGNCYSLSSPTGHVIHVDPSSQGPDVDVSIYDATGTQVCVDDRGDCTLTGTGPYRVFASSGTGGADNYEFQLADITNPVGCLAVAQQTFGQVPVLSADLCRTLTVTKSNQYQIYAVDKESGTLPGSLYAPDGGLACQGTGPYCQLSPGSYDFVSDTLLDGDELGAVFIAADESSGCMAANDTGFASGDATGTFSGPGEELCRRLPTAAGLSDYLMQQPVSGAEGYVLNVVDATGAVVCPDVFTYSSLGTCALTGTAPFRVVLASAGAGSSFRLLVQRTDLTTGCLNWPRSGFGTTGGAHVKLTRVDNAACLVIPAADHSAEESVTDADATNGAVAGLAVNDPTGNTVCSGNGYPSSWTVCDYKSGVTYTALLAVTSLGSLPASGDTYSLARRDLTNAAGCSSPVSTVAEGPSTTFTLGSSIAQRCFHVTAAAADKLWFSYRSIAPADPTTFGTLRVMMDVFDASGTAVCGASLICQVSGSTSYEIVFFTTDYTGAAITVHLDTWLVATAAGWVSQCAKNHFSGAGKWGPVGTTLTDRSAGYCALVDIAPNESFNLYAVDNAISPNMLWADVYPPTTWGARIYSGVCEGGFQSGSDSCNVPLSVAGGTALLVVTPFDFSQNPIQFSLQGVCQATCSSPPQAATITSVSPPSQSAGPGNTVVVTGTNLTYGTQFDLFSQSSANEYQIATPVAVNAAGTSLTFRLDTSQVPPGTYNVSLGQSSCSPPFPCQGWLQNGYTVKPGPKPTPPSRFMAVRPSRILNRQVGPDGTLTFPVTGRGGVPATQVHAVVLDVTAVAPTRAGHLTVYSGGQPRPPANSVEFGTGQTMTGLVTVDVINGKASVYNASSGATDLTADVVGYYTSSGTGTGLTLVNSTPILNTTQVGAGKTAVLSVAGRGGVPATGATAVALNVTAIAPAKAGQLVVSADGAARPGVTSLSFAAGQRVTQQVIAQLVDGKVDLYNGSAGPLDLTADVVGYYSASGSVFHPLNEVRVMDTRSGLGGAGQTILPQAVAVFNALGSSAIPSGTNVTDVLLNVTVVGQQRSGTLTAFPDNTYPLPATPDVAFTATQSQSNPVALPGGSVDFYNRSTGNVQVVVDLEGYYTSS